MRKYQSLSTSETSFKKIAMNFITKFSKFQNSIIKTLYDMIAIIVNELIKYVKFVLYQFTITIKQLTYLLIKEIFANYNVFE